MGATLDGRVEATGAVFEAKFMLPGHSWKKPAPRSIWLNFSTTCGWWLQRAAVGGSPVAEVWVEITTHAVAPPVFSPFHKGRRGWPQAPIGSAENTRTPAAFVSESFNFYAMHQRSQPIREFFPACWRDRRRWLAETHENCRTEWSGSSRFEYFQFLRELPAFSTIFRLPPFIGIITVRVNRG